MVDILQEFKDWAVLLGLNLARSNNLFWHKKTQEKWLEYKQQVKYVCVGIEIESTVYSGCDCSLGLSDCPTCGGSGIMFNCPNCGEILKSTGLCMVNDCWFPVDLAY